MTLLQIELALLILIVWGYLDQLAYSARSSHKEVRKIRKRLKYGVRTFSLPVRLVFLNSEGKEILKMNIQDSGQILTPTLSAVDAAGNPAPLDAASAAVWSLDDSSMGVVDAASGVFTPSGKLGSVNLDVSVPAVGAQPALAGSLAVVVVAGAAVALSIAGAVSAAPAPAAPSA